MEKCTKYMQKMVADLVGDVFHPLLLGRGCVHQDSSSGEHTGVLGGSVVSGIWDKVGVPPLHI